MAKIAHRLGSIVAVTLLAAGAGASAASGPRAPAVAAPAQVLYAKLFQAALRASRAARRIVSFTSTDADPRVDDLYPLAAARASDAIVALASTPGGRRTLLSIDAVRLAQRPSADATIEGRTLVIGVNPAMGASGCPSTRSIEQAFWRSRANPQPRRWATAST